MASISGDSITITARCLCKANIFQAQVPKSQLPLKPYLCHCNTCRHTLGTMYNNAVIWPTPRAQVDVSKLKSFRYFSNYDVHFCPTCSTPMFSSDAVDLEYPLKIFTGLLENVDVDLIEFKHQCFVHDTLDGGASVWMEHNANGSEIPRYAGHSNTEELAKDWPPREALTGYEAKKEDAVPIRCKCRGVDLILHRGDYTGIPEQELQYNVDPKTHKLLAGFCGCDSCRLQGGVDLFIWAFAEMKYISFASSDTAFPKAAAGLKDLVDANDPAVGTLVYYSSREDVERYFCSKCSACVFYATTRLPHHLDISVGVLEASDGARAEGILSWPYGARISFREDGDGGWRAKLFDAVEKSAEAYRISRAYPKNWHRQAKDDNGGRTPQ